MKKNKFPAEAMADIMNRMQSFGELKTVFNTAEKAIYIYEGFYSIPGSPNCSYSFDTMDNKPFAVVKSAKEFNVFLDTYQNCLDKHSEEMRSEHASKAVEINKLKEELKETKESEESYSSRYYDTLSENRDLKRKLEVEKNELSKELELYKTYNDNKGAQIKRDMKIIQAKAFKIRALKGQLTKAKNKAAKLQDEVNRFRKGLTN